MKRNNLQASSPCINNHSLESLRSGDLCLIFLTCSSFILCFVVLIADIVSLSILCIFIYFRYLQISCNVLCDVEIDDWIY